MKKLLCAALVITILFASFPGSSSALTEDEYKQQIRAMFADASDDDLKSLFEAVQYELMCRGYKFSFDEQSNEASVQKEETELKEVTVPAGKYTIGSDIPAGTYTLNTADYLSIVSIWDASGGLVTMHTLSAQASVGKIELKNGQSIEINGSAVVFKPYAGLGF